MLNSKSGCSLLLLLPQPSSWRRASTRQLSPKVFSGCSLLLFFCFKESYIAHKFNSVSFSSWKTHSTVLITRWLNFPRMSFKRRRHVPCIFLATHDWCCKIDAAGSSLEAAAYYSIYSAAHTILGVCECLSCLLSCHLREEPSLLCWLRGPSILEFLY